MKTKTSFFLPALILIACCLRSPLTGVGPLVGFIRNEYSLSGGSAGLITTLPLLTFAVSSFLIGAISIKIGEGNTILLGMGLLFVGILVRSFLGLSGLFLGAVLVGLGIASGNVLLPVIVKSRYPQKVGLLTGVYSTAMSSLAAVASAVSIPVARMLGWRESLALWSCLTFLSFLVWLPHRRIHLHKKAEGKRFFAVVHSKFTWLSTGYMGIQSMLYYCTVSWMSSILQFKEFSPEASGYLNSVYLLFAIPFSFLVPWIEGRTRRFSQTGLCLGLLYVFGFLLLLTVKNHALIVLALFCCAISSGANLAHSMLLYSIHTETAADAAAVSGIAQSIGYLIAAIGPACLGFVYDRAGDWHIPIALLILFSAGLAVIGFFAGKGGLSEKE